MKKIVAVMMAVLLSGCATLTTDQGGNAVKVAEAKYNQPTTFETVCIEGTNVSFKIEGATKIAFQSYKPPISLVPEPSIVDRICDAAKWLGGFWIGGEVLKSVSAKTVVDPTIVRPEVVTVPAM
jgi:hypothetical protein